ncbi:MFS transporter [Limnoglobus roseus]|uniref:MFS transporter n=1 Tax=Limnoglobus roseus TaxID=2598579 RepID=UPI0011EAB174|nr:MFS transporter [Limnoglobus roseus]
MPFRLAGMMFLQYAALGAWIVTLSSWLVQPAGQGGLGFSSQQTAFLYATQAIGGLVAPFITGLLADRFFASEKLVGTMHLFMAGSMVGIGQVAKSFAGENANPPVACLYLFFALLGYSIASVFAITVGNSMAMRTLANPQKSFGPVRSMGTLGWIVSSNVVERFFRLQSEDLFAVSAACHVILGLLAWKLPHTPPKGRGRPIPEVMGLPAMKLFRDPSFIVFAAVAFLIQMMQQFYTVFATPYLLDLGMANPVAKLSLAQFVEMGCMASLSFMVVRFGLKTTMIVGLLAWVLRNSVLMGGNIPAITAVAIPMHGVSYTFFSIVAALYIDKEAPPHLRAGAQALLTFVAGGPGTLLGFFLGGWVKDAHTHGPTTDWPAVWLVPVVGCTVATIVFIVFFHEPKVPQPADGTPTPELLPENP